MRLTFPLYHATSSNFLGSIKECGLGGKNIISELRVLDLLKELETLADQKLAHLDDWQYVMKYPVSLITGQRIVPGGNFQHGAVYLTPSTFTAHRYSDNAFGSEAISESFKVIDLLRKSGIALTDSILDGYKSVLDLEKEPMNPVIIEINDLPIEYLKATEDGDDRIVSEYVRKIEAYITEYGKEGYHGHVDQLNFKLGKPIEWSRLKINVLRKR